MDHHPMLHVTLRFWFPVKHCKNKMCARYYNATYKSHRSSTRCLHQGRTNTGTLMNIISCQQMSHSIKIKTNLDARPGSAPDAELLIKTPVKFHCCMRISEDRKRIIPPQLPARSLLFTVSYLNSKPSSMLSTTATLTRNTRLIWGVRLLHSSPLVKMPIQVTLYLFESLTVWGLWANTLRVVLRGINLSVASGLSLALTRRGCFFPLWGRQDSQVIDIQICSPWPLRSCLNVTYTSTTPAWLVVVAELWEGRSSGTCALGP